VPSEPHKTRPLLSPRQPIQVTSRLRRAATFSRGHTYRVLDRALTTSLARSNFRIVHIAVVRSRLELIVEADDKLALARGMQGFQVSAARSLNRATGRRGTVFPDRYRMRVLTTRVDVRDAIGRLPKPRMNAWPETSLLVLEHSGGASPRRWTGSSRWSSPRRRLRSRADEDS
jgi:hypothetical protein